MKVLNGLLTRLKTRSKYYLKANYIGSILKFNSINCIWAFLDVASITKYRGMNYYLIIYVPDISYSIAAIYK